MFIEAKDDGGGGDNWTLSLSLSLSLSTGKLQSNHHHQQTNIQFLQVRCPSCRPTNNVQALNGKYWRMILQVRTTILPGDMILLGNI